MTKDSRPFCEEIRIGLNYFNKKKLIPTLEASSRIFMRIWCEILTFQLNSITFQIKRKSKKNYYFATFHAFFSGWKIFIQSTIFHRNSICFKIKMLATWDDILCWCHLNLDFLLFFLLNSSEKPLKCYEKSKLSFKKSLHKNSLKTSQLKCPKINFSFMKNRSLSRTKFSINHRRQKTETVTLFPDFDWIQ